MTDAAVRTSCKRTIAWALYDFGNSAFATTVMAGLFPVFFKPYYSAGSDVTASTFKLGLANSGAGLLVLPAAPVLGAVADRGGARKRFLAAFAALGAAMSVSLVFVGRGQWAAAVFALATVGFSGANTFYDALLVAAAGEDKVDLVSAMGYSLGYLGGGLLFAVHVLMVLRPGLFGLADQAQAVKVSFVTVGLWWIAFAVPLMALVPETLPAGPAPRGRTVSEGLRPFAGTFRDVRKLKVVSLFFAAYWLYIDGVDTVIRMAVDYGLSIGLDSDNLIPALLMVQFIGFPAALAFGKLGEKPGPKTGILIALAVYIAMTFRAYRLDSAAEFFGMAAAVGLVQGGLQALSRSLYTRLIPKDKAAEFFGFFNMVGRFAVVLGPFLMGWTALLTGSSRLSVFAVTALPALGGVILFFVDVEEGRAMAREI